MAFEYTTLAWEHSKAAGNARLVLLVLADRANEIGECWPSVSDIVSRTKASERTVQAALRELEELGEIEVNYNRGRRGSNMYRITIKPSFPKTPARIAPPADSAPSTDSELSETPADSAPPQISHPTPADSAPESIKNLSLEPNKNHIVEKAPDLDAVVEALYDAFPDCRKHAPHRVADIRIIRSVVLEPGLRSMADHCAMLLASTRAMAKWYEAELAKAPQPMEFNPTPGIRKFFVEKRLWDQPLDVWSLGSSGNAPPGKLVGLYDPDGKEFFVDESKAEELLAKGWTREPKKTEKVASW